MAAQLPEQIWQIQICPARPCADPWQCCLCPAQSLQGSVICSCLLQLGLSHSSHDQPYSTSSVPRVHSALTWKHSSSYLHLANSFSSFKSQLKCSRKAFAHPLCSTYHTWLNFCLPLSNPITMRTICVSCWLQHPQQLAEWLTHSWHV